MTKSKSRVAFISGASRGIGQAIKTTFEQNEIEVIAPRRCELDLADPQSIRNYFLNVPRDVDIVVNCAGINILSSFEQLNMDEMHQVFQTNFFSAVQILQEFLPGMRERHYGRIVNIESLYSLISKEKRISYAASKSALSGLTKTLAVEYGRHNVLVNAVLPGYVLTEMTEKNLTELDIQRIVGRIPLGRLAHPDEIAELVLFLCSDKNSYVTGQLIVADGGFISN